MPDMDLQAYLSEQQVDLAAFAKSVGVTATALKRYIDGERRPKAEVLERIHQETGGKVQPNDFFPFVAKSEAA